LVVHVITVPTLVQSAYETYPTLNNPEKKTNAKNDFILFLPCLDEALFGPFFPALKFPRCCSHRPKNGPNRGAHRTTSLRRRATLGPHSPFPTRAGSDAQSRRGRPGSARADETCTVTIIERLLMRFPQPTRRIIGTDLSFFIAPRDLIVHLKKQEQLLCYLGYRCDMLIVNGSKYPALCLRTEIAPTRTELVQRDTALSQSTQPPPRKPSPLAAFADWR